MIRAPERAASRLRSAAADDHGFLVGQGHAPPGPDGLEGRLQAGDPGDGRDDDVAPSAAAHFDGPFRPVDDAHPPPCPEAADPVGVLLSQGPRRAQAGTSAIWEARRADVGAGGQGDDAEAPAQAVDDVERARSDGTRRAEDGETARRLSRSLFPEGDDDEIEEGAGQDQAVDAVEEAAVAGQSVGGILDPDGPLEQGLQRIADLGGGVDDDGGQEGCRERDPGQE